MRDSMAGTSGQKLTAYINITNSQARMMTCMRYLVGSAVILPPGVCGYNANWLSSPEFP